LLTVRSGSRLTAPTQLG